MKKIIIKMAITTICLMMSMFLTGFESRAYEETYISSEYVEYCKEIGRGYDINCWVLVALIEAESSGNPNAVDYLTGTHIGLMQLSMYYFGGDGIELTDPYTNIMIGTRYLASLYDDVNDIGIALMQYHGEANATTKPLSGYASEILCRADELKWGNGEKNLKEINKNMKRRFCKWML